MRYVAAYLLAVLGGKNKPSQADVEKILGSVGIEVDSERLKKVLGELSGKDLEQLIEAGRGKLASMPTAAAPAAAGPAGAAPAAAKEEKKKEEKKEESEEEDDDMGFGLFD